MYLLYIMSAISSTCLTGWSVILNNIMTTFAQWLVIRGAAPLLNQELEVIQSETEED